MSRFHWFRWRHNWTPDLPFLATPVKESTPLSEAIHPSAPQSLCSLFSTLRHQEGRKRPRPPVLWTQDSRALTSAAQQMFAEWSDDWVWVVLVREGCLRAEGPWCARAVQRQVRITERKGKLWTLGVWVLCAWVLGEGSKGRWALPGPDFSFLRASDDALTWECRSSPPSP